MRISLDELANDERQLDLLADKLAERLAARLSLPTAPPEAEALVDANEVARLTGRSRKWVYEHSGELGAVRLGSGRCPRLGFFPARVLEHFQKVTDPRPEPRPTYAKPRRRQRPGYTATGVPLLNVRPTRVRPTRSNEP